MPEQSSKENARFQKILQRNLVLPLMVGGISAAIFVGLILYLLNTLDWVKHTQQVIANTNDLTTLAVDLQTGVRGYVLTNEDRFLEPYNTGKAKFQARLAALRDLVKDNPTQVDRLRRIESLSQQWEGYAQELIDARRSGGDYENLARLDRGKQLFDEIRRELMETTELERGLLTERSQNATRATYLTISLYVLFIIGLSGFIALFGRRQIMELANTYSTALDEQRAAAEVMQAQAWLRAGQADLNEHLVGQLALPAIGDNTLDFAARYLGATIGAFYVRDDTDLLQRAAAHGFDKHSEQMQTFTLGQGLVGQTVRDARINHLRNLKTGYLKIASGLGEDKPMEVVLAPVKHDGRVNGVIELGFLRAVEKREIELLGMIAAGIGASVQAAQYRKRLQDSLEETQQLNEELQTQQEELRTANEELEEQARVLAESQANLEQQQAELEQTNVQLEEQSAIVDRKNEALNAAQAELQQRAEELQRASRYKSEFLANMSHELRTPLNSSLILAKLLHENKPGNLNEEQVKFAQTIYSAGNDLLNLINDILDLSKVEAGKMELSPQAVNLDRMLEALKLGFEPLAQEKKLSFEVSKEKGAPESIYTDRQRVEQILKNLLSNAIKFTQKGRVILTAAPAGDGRIAFSVRDTGIGIAAEQKDVIFEAFRQADGTINRGYGGTGLGLSISRELAHLLGGAIEVSSKQGEGSVFTLDLPLTYVARPAAPAMAPRSFPVAVPAVAAARPAPTTPPLSSFNDDRDKLGPGARVVLIVEDDEAFARILFDLSHEMRYRCLVALGAEEGFRLAAQYQPNAILLDVRLPDGSGLSVLQQLKDHPKTRHIPVHIISAEDYSEVVMHMGAVGFAMKPTTREQLRDILGKLEAASQKKPKRVLLVEDDQRQRESIVHLIGEEEIDITAVERGEQALEHLRDTVFDCMIIDLKLPDMDGSELLERMTREEICSFPPVIVYTGRELTREEEAQLNRYSRSIIIKGARSPERLLDEVTLFLHQVESTLSVERQKLLRASRNRDMVFENRKLLLVDDDIRNIFALTSALEQRGLKVEIARNGLEALAKLEEEADIEIVLMDIMMPGMDGLEATRRIRANPKLAKLPVIAITAKAMKDDQEQCRKAGANDYLAKPIDLDRLFSLIRVWMPSLRH